MNQTQRFTKTTIAVFAALGLLSGCNWVDSTGRQSNNTPTIVLDDGTPDDGFSLSLNEEGTGVIDPSKSSDGDGAIVSWTWDKSTVSAGALTVCNTDDGFNAALAAQSLSEACTNQNQCEVHVETEEVEKTDAEIAVDQASLDALGSTAEVSPLKTVFTLTAPQLKAPVGVTYRIVAKDNDGGSGFAEVTLCLIAINEAPDAIDDSFTVLEGVTKEVLASDPVNLLTNDIDDIDVSNLPLAVSAVENSTPEHNNDFTLGTDGGFTYYYAGDPTRPAGEESFDEFEYQVSDGLHTSQAKVTLRIVTVDDAPVLTSSIPDLKFYEGINDRINFGKYFTDPEGATLIFSESNNALPDSFDKAQLSKGFLQSTPKSNEVDQYSLVLSARDDLTTTSDSVVLTIAENQRPSFANISNQSGALGKSFSLDIGKFTKDPEGQPLTHRLTKGPSFFKIDGSILKGTPTSSNSWKVTVSVSDGYNTPESGSFTFTVVNSAPVLTGSIPNQTIAVGQKLSFNASNYFSDPEGQKLSYRLTSSPSYLSINASGVISGTPTTTGTAAITVSASDGEKSISDTFTLTVTNPSPVLKSKITDRTYTAGEVIDVNIAQHFSDPNGDKLTFRSSGLPASKQIKITTSGIMSGAATTIDAGTYTVTVIATDGTSETKGSFKLTINKKPNNKPTLVSSGSGGTVTKGDSVSFTSTFKDTDAGDSLTITGTTGGSGFSIKQSNNNGVLSGTANKAGTFTINVTAKDPSGASVVDQYKIKVVAANSPPTLLSSGSGGTVTKGDSASFTSTFKDSDSGDTLTITGTTDGSGFSIKQSNNTGVLSGTANKVGTFTIKVTAKDPSGASVVDQYKIKVVAANSPPTLVSSGSGGTVKKGDSASFTSTFKDTDAGDALTVTGTTGGSGFSIKQSNNSGVLSGTANKVGTFAINVTAKDPSGASVVDQYKIKVVAANSPPTLASSGSGGTVNKGDLVSFTSTFKDADAGDSLTITGTTDGSGFSIKQNNNTGVLSGTANKVGTFTIKVTAKDLSTASVVDQYTIKVVAANRAPTIVSSGTGGSFVLGTPVSFTTTFNDPDNDALTMTWFFGDSTLKPKISADGKSVTMSGTPPIGTYPIAVTAKDPSGAGINDDYTVVIAAP